MLISTKINDALMTKIRWRIVVFSGFWAESLYNRWEIVVYAESSKKSSQNLGKNRKKS